MELCKCKHNNNMEKAVSDPLLWLYPNISNYAARAPGQTKRRQTKYSIWPGEIVAKGRWSKAARDACRGLGHPERRFFLRWAGPGDRHAPTGRDSRCVCLQQPADQAMASSQSLGGPTWQRKNTWSERAIDRERDKSAQADWRTNRAVSGRVHHYRSPP